MNGNKKQNLDPLYRLFEHFLVTRSYEDSGAFTKQLADQYLAYLDSTSAHVPYHVRVSVLEDLKSEAHELLVKKMYGCVRIADYENFGHVKQMGKTDEVQEFDFEPAAPAASAKPKG